MLALLPAAGVSVCFGSDHVEVGPATAERDCPCSDHDEHGDEGTPCSDVSVAVPDFRDDHAPGASLAAPPVALAPVPCATRIAVRSTPSPRPPAAALGARLAVHRTVVLLI